MKTSRGTETFVLFALLFFFIFLSLKWKPLGVLRLDNNCIGIWSFSYRWNENLSGYWDFCWVKFPDQGWRVYRWNENLSGYWDSANPNRTIEGPFYRWNENLSGYWDKMKLFDSYPLDLYRWNENLSGYWDFHWRNNWFFVDSIAEMKTSRGTETTITQINILARYNYRWNENLSGYWDKIRIFIFLQF